MEDDPLRRCKPCLDRNHEGCEGITTTGWCECPCHSGELRDPTVAPGVQDVPNPRLPD